MSLADLATRLRNLVVIDEVGSDSPLGRDAADALEAADAVAKATHDVVSAVTFDDSGTHAKGGNGGLLSRETIRKTDELRLALARLEART